MGSNINTDNEQNNSGLAKEKFDSNLSMSWTTIETSLGTNEILVCRLMANGDSKSESILETRDLVIYFGGDIQDSIENMKRNTEFFNDWGAYSLENTAMILHHKFPHSNIILIRANIMNNNAIAIYSNFLPIVNKTAWNSLSLIRGHACAHLMQILHKLQLTSNMPVCPYIHMIGFSRGVNVITKIVTECVSTNIKTCDNEESDAKKLSINENVLNVFQRLRSIYFLDGGNGHQRNTHPINAENIECLANVISNVDRDENDLFGFHLYGTHRQWKNCKQPWIYEEKNEFMRLLLLQNKMYKCENKERFRVHEKLYGNQELNESLECNANINAKLLSNLKCDVKMSLYHHFEILRCFNTNCKRFIKK